MKKVLSLILSVLLVLSLVPMAVGADAVPAWDELAYYQDGPEFSVSATGFTGDASNYKFYAAAYDASDRLLHVVSTDKVTVEGGELAAKVNFEANGKATNVNIDYVKTMLWDGLTPVVRNGLFDKVGEISQGVVSGFYEPVEKDDGTAITYTSSAVYDYNSTTKALSSSNNRNATLMSDNNLQTEEGNNGAATGKTQSVFLTMSAAVSPDAVVVYNASAGGKNKGLEFYLTTGAPKNIAAQFLGENTVSQDGSILYLGTQTEAPKTLEDEGAMLFFPVSTTNKYSCIVAYANEGVSAGLIQEMQAYQKVQDDDVVTAFTPRASFETASYTQDGPVFSVNATGFTTNIDNFTLVAKAFDGSGTQVGETLESPAAVNEGVLSGYVDFEPGNNVEADSSIASVTVSVIAKDYDNMVIVPEKTFNLTVPSDANKNLTNGFYEAVKNSEGAAITHTGKNRYYNYDAAQAKWVVYAGTNQPNLVDGNTTTYAGAAGTSYIVAENQVRQLQVELAQKAKIDRVVIYIRWYDNNNTMQFYLSNALTDPSTCGDYTGVTDDEKGVLYLGVPAGKGTAGQPYKNVFDVTGGLEGGYQYITTHPVVGNYYGPVYEMQAYQKVQLTIPVENN